MHDQTDSDPGTISQTTAVCQILLSILPPLQDWESVFFVHGYNYYIAAIYFSVPWIDDPYRDLNMNNKDHQVN